MRERCKSNEGDIEKAKREEQMKDREGRRK